MHKRELTSILTFYAVSPIHAGSGAAVATVDLPIQRERHTGYPHIQASGVKGALRAHFREFITDGGELSITENKIKQGKYLTNLIFGIDEDNDEKVRNADNKQYYEYEDKEKKIKYTTEKMNEDYKPVKTLPGAISVSDAKLLAFPMRSNVAPFVWVTCPTIMNRLKRDLEFSKINEIDNPFEVTDEEAEVLEGDIKKDTQIILEDSIVKVVSEKATQIQFIKDNFTDIDKLLLISDEMFDYCVSSCTEIQTNIKIDSKTGTATDGALRYQEFLPADSVLYSIVYYSKQHLNDLQADIIKKCVEDNIKGFIQIGGDETLGKGVCKINWISPNGNNGGN